MTRQLSNISRRAALQQGLQTAFVSAQENWPQWMPRIAVAQRQKKFSGDTLVCIFLRGGADGLNIIVPYGDPHYYQARPTIALARPDDRRAPRNQKTLALDGFFGAHPAMIPLKPFFEQHQLLAIHATGSPNPTRSHFEAMDYMERGDVASHVLSTGWLGRHLASKETGNHALIRGIGWGNQLQQSLRGSVSATALRSIIAYHQVGDVPTANQMQIALNSLYNLDSGDLQECAQQTKEMIALLKKINVASYKPSAGVKYDTDSNLDMALMQTAALIKANVGLEVAAIDLGGWDTHVSERAGIAAALTELSKGLANFGHDMAHSMHKLTVVVMSEFGRRVGENSDGGTDHGHGNMMLVMGGNVAHKPVIARWPSLQATHLDNGDLAITIDYRDVLSEILMKRLKNPHISTVFPHFKPTMHRIVN